MHSTDPNITFNNYKHKEDEQLKSYPLNIFKSIKYINKDGKVC